MIQDIVKKDLCTGCGTCYSICKYDAVSMSIAENGVYKPIIDDNKCTHCKLCLHVCPGQLMDFRALSYNIFQREVNDYLLGNASQYYVGYSLDSEIRNNSTSGGLVTQLLICALNNGLITGAVVTRMSKDNPLVPEPFIARTQEEIIEASCSKYCPVPVNMALKELVKTGSKETIAVVGLPCHIHGLQKAKYKGLFKCNLIFFGIFCGHTPSFNATQWLLRQNGINVADVKQIEYRGKGWPGSMTVTCMDGSKVSLDYHMYWDSGFGKYFFPPRCTLCYDGTAEFADISFGDAWLPRFKNDRIGTSVIISRTSVGDRLLSQCKGIIELQKVDRDEVVASQRSMLAYKKKGYSARKAIRRFTQHKTPDYNITEVKPKFVDYLGAISVYVSLWMAKHHLWPLLKVHSIVTRICRFVYKRQKNP